MKPRKGISRTKAQVAEVLSEYLPAENMKQRNLYEHDDIVRLYRTKSLVAEALGIHPAQVTRWRGRIPDEKQMQIMRILDNDNVLRRQHAAIKRERIERERA